MNLQELIRKCILVLAAISTFIPSVRASEKVGKVCVEAIPTGGNWTANDTGATERSVFTVHQACSPTWRSPSGTSLRFNWMASHSHHFPSRFRSEAIIYDSGTMNSTAPGRSGM
jgi:hypothetical protein